MNEPAEPTPADAGKDRGTLEDRLAAACMALLLLITLGNVLTRYFTDQSFAWTEEVSVFLLVLLTLAGAGAAAARDRHIRIEFVYEGGSAARRRALAIFGAGITALVFVVLAVLSGRMVADEMRWGETTMGLAVPRWWYTLAIPLLCLAIAARALGVARRAWRSTPR